MCEAGNRVVFEDSDDSGIGGYVESKITGEQVPISKDGGTYSVSLWVPADEAENSSRFASDNNFAPLSADEASSSRPSDFPRHA